MITYLRVLAVLIGIVAPLPVLVFFSFLWFAVLIQGFSISDFIQHAQFLLFYTFIVISGWIGISFLSVMIFKIGKEDTRISWSSFVGIALGMISAIFFTGLQLRNLRYTEIQNAFDLFPFLVLGPILVSVIILMTSRKPWAKSQNPNKSCPLKEAIDDR